MDTCPLGTFENEEEAVCERADASTTFNSTDFPAGDGVYPQQSVIEKCNVQNCDKCGLDANYC